MNSKYRDPEELSKDARDLISKLIVTNPDKRLPLKYIKRHPFFTSCKPPIDFALVSEGKLRMPNISHRPIIKSKLPFNYNGDSDDEGEGEDRYDRR
jgi:hypothetical protein